jgi:hypothetical protein
MCAFCMQKSSLYVFNLPRACRMPSHCTEDWALLMSTRKEVGGSLLFWKQWCLRTSTLFRCHLPLPSCLSAVFTWLPTDITCAVLFPRLTIYGVSRWSPAALQTFLTQRRTAGGGLHMLTHASAALSKGAPSLTGTTDFQFTSVSLAREAGILPLLQMQVIGCKMEGMPFCPLGKSNAETVGTIDNVPNQPS